MTNNRLDDSSLSCVDQRHEPLTFLSDQFNDASLRWSKSEEVYAIMMTFARMHWLLACNRRINLHTAHNNPVFLFDPTPVVADL